MQVIIDTTQKFVINSIVDDLKQKNSAAHLFNQLLRRDCARISLVSRIIYLIALYLPIQSCQSVSAFQDMQSCIRFFHLQGASVLLSIGLCGDWWADPLSTA